jgi:hypothetical protein
MSTYEMIEELIYNRTMCVITGRKLINEAYTKEQIERWQFDDLIELANKYL